MSAPGSINPTRERFKALYGLPLDRPVHMLNLLRFRSAAAYAPGDPEHGETPVTGVVAYRRYAEESGPYFRGVGGYALWIGTPELGLIAPEDEHWDLAFVAVYPTGQAFIDMVKNPDYQRATRHRTAGIADSRLIRCAPAQAGGSFWPEG